MPPLILVWRPGSDRVGDFTWPGFGSEVVVTSEALQLLERFSGGAPGPVEVVADSDAPKRARIVPLPYRGPPLHEVWVTTMVDLDRERSSVELEHVCDACGSERWALFGVARWDSCLDRETMELHRTQTAKVPGAGVFVREADLDGNGLFRVRQFPAWVFCTDDVRRAVEAEQLSNVSFLEMGETC